MLGWIRPGVLVTAGLEFESQWVRGWAVAGAEAVWFKQDRTNLLIRILGLWGCEWVLSAPYYDRYLLCFSRCPQTPLVGTSTSVN